MRTRDERERRKSCCTVDAGRLRKRAVKESLFHHCVLHPFPCAVFSFIALNSSDTKLAPGHLFNSLHLYHYKIACYCYGHQKRISHRGEVSKPNVTICAHDFSVKLRNCPMRLRFYIQIYIEAVCRNYKIHEKFTLEKVIKIYSTERNSHVEVNCRESQEAKFYLLLVYVICLFIFVYVIFF